MIKKLIPISYKTKRPAHLGIQPIPSKVLPQANPQGNP